MLRSGASFRTHVCRCHNVKNALQHTQSSSTGHELEHEMVLGNEVMDSLDQCSKGGSCGEPSALSSENDLYTENFALFLLKLECKHHVPAKTVHYVAKGMKNLHRLSQDVALKEVATIVPQETFAAVQSRLANDNLNIASQALTSCYQRHKYYKEKFCYVSPTEIHLGLNKQNSASICHYVPVAGLIQFLLHFSPTSSELPTSQTMSDDIFSDFTLCQPFREQDNVIQIILYQDEFEIVNPLGSAKGNFKLLGVYMTLGNLPLHCRSNVESLQLVMLCRNKDIREFGLNLVLQPLIKDLVSLESSGLSINEVHYAVRLSFIAGDNLGSHMVGGFTQNFSTSMYFCRFCLVTRTEFEQVPNAVGECRTPKNYNESLGRLANGNGAQSDCGLTGNSPFHALKHFHVCNPGLPPCIGHDLFEGVVQYDLALCIHYFVNKGWFTYDYLNNRISTMKLNAHDLRNKPAKVSVNNNKLGGHALQNWTLLRLFPVYLGTKVEDMTDAVWELVITLMQIVDLLMAPKITAAQVAYMKVLIEDYVVSRCELFPRDKLRPKHHNMLHYSELVQHFGPLCHVWTMRFESKHQYFKECIRSVRNYKNVTKTLSERHQLFQSFLAARGLFCIATEFTDMSPSEQLKVLGKLKRKDFSDDCMLLKKATVEGYTYACNDYVLISGTRFSVVFGSVMAIVKDQSDVVALLLQCTPAALLPALELYGLRHSTEETVLLHPYELLDRTAYQPYSFNGNPVVRLNFSFCEKL